MESVMVIHLLLYILKWQQLQVRYTIKMSDISCKERKFMSFTNTGNKGVFDAYVQSLACKGIVKGSGFVCSSLIKGKNSNIGQKPVYEVCLAAFLNSIQKIIYCSGGYMEMIFEICPFQKLSAGLPLSKIVNNDVCVYNYFRGFHLLHFLLSSLIGPSISMSLSAPSRARKPFFSFVMMRESLCTFMSTFSPSSILSLARRFSGMVI